MSMKTLIRFLVYVAIFVISIFIINVGEYITVSTELILQHIDEHVAM